MPVVTHWYDQTNTIVHIKISDPWTIRDLSSGIQVSRKLMSSVNYTVDAIWDGEETKGLPNNVLSHFMFANEDTVIPQNQGAVVVVVRGTLLNKFATLAKRILPQITRNMHITDSLPAAEEKSRRCAQPAEVKQLHTNGK